MAFNSFNYSKVLIPIGIIGFIVLLLALISGIRSRGSGGRISAKGLPCIEQSQENRIETDTATKMNLTVNVGIDGSQSLLGFVREGNSRYVRTIQKLDDLLRSGNLQTNLSRVQKFESFNVNYWRLGINTELTPEINQKQAVDVTQFLDAKDPRFYCQGLPSDYPCVTSSLHQILDLHTAETSTTTPIPDQAEVMTQSGDETKIIIRNDTFQILITDLEPDNSAISEMTSRISKVLNTRKDYKVALLGIRSEFNGRVYSAANPENNIPYQSNGDVNEQGRPFYLVLLGPVQIVDSFVERFEDRVGNIADGMKTSYFQHQNFSPIVLNVSEKFGEREDDCTYRESTLNGDRLEEDQEPHWLLLSQEKCDDSYKEFKLNNVKSTRSLLLRGGNFTPEMFKRSEPFVKVTEVSLGDEEDIPYLNLTIDINGAEAGTDEQAIYLTLQESALDGIVWQDWSVPVTSDLEGAKTQQLIDFVKSIRDAVPKNQDALRFCLGYIRD